MRQQKDIPSLKKGFLFFVGLFLYCSSTFFAAAGVLDRKPREIQSGSTDDLLQFTAGGHVLGFRKGEMFMASGDHALSVEFVNARRVSPEEKTAAPNPDKSARAARPLGKIAYGDLWDGVTLVYENRGAGAIENSYRIEGRAFTAEVAPRAKSEALTRDANTRLSAAEADPQTKPGAPAAVDRIRLRYNAPVKVDEAGSLIFSFKTGEMRASRPLAWQEIEGKRIPVEVQYRLNGEQEVGFKVRNYNSEYSLAIEVALSWNTFLGSSNDDSGSGIAVDTSGNVYVTGSSETTWGAPIRPHTGGSYYYEARINWYPDVFVAKLNSSGALQWNTFLGGSNYDSGGSLAVDMRGNVYVTGSSSATWGSPVRPRSGGELADAFVAKLNNDGALQWNTFLGGSDADWAHDIAVDMSGNIYVTGDSSAPWGSPVRPFADVYYYDDYYGPTWRPDAFVAKLNNDGILQWNTFLGGTDTDYGYGIALDMSGNVYMTGLSFYQTWGSPVRPFTSGSYDVFVAKLNNDGALQWNTFLGGLEGDWAGDIAVDMSGNIYVTGDSSASWGSPAHPFVGGAFAAKLNNNGALQWNTFLEGNYGRGIAIDRNDNIFVTGSSIRSLNDGYTDILIAKLNNGGIQNWSIFLGGSNSDFGSGIALDTSGNVHVTGSSRATWGSPIRTYAGGSDAFVAQIMEGEGYHLTIASDPHGTTNPVPGVYFRAAGSNASVSAIADSGYALDRWTGDVPAGQETSTTVSIHMNADKSVRASFKEVKALQIAVNNAALGTTSPVPGTHTYAPGTDIQILALPAQRCAFTGWSGDAGGASNPITIHMDRDKSVTANFVELKTLQIAVNNTSLGMTSPVPGTYTYLPGSDVQILASPAQSCVFMGWGGDASGTANPIAVHMDRDKSVTSNFMLINSPSNLTAARMTNRSVAMIEYIVDLRWDPSPANDGLNIVGYRVYQKVGEAWVMLAGLSLDNLTYRVRRVPKAEQTFAITSVNENGVESAKITIVK